MVTNHKHLLSMQMVAAMAISELSERLNRPRISILEDFFTSVTGKMLFADDTDLWTCGPSYVADEYLLEKGKS